MSIRQLTLAFAASLLLPLCLFAQSEYTNAATEAFKNLDQSGITSGILYDRVFPHSDLNNFTSASTSNYGHFRQAFADLYWASLSQSKRLKTNDFSELAEQAQRSGTFAVGVINARYHALNFDAIEKDGSGHYRVKPGWSGSIYQPKQANMVAILTPTVYGSAMPVNLPRWASLSHNEASITQVQIQVAGYTRTLTPDGPTQYIYFDNSGSFTAQFTVSLSNGTSFTAQSSVRAELPSGFQPSRVSATLADPIYFAPFPRNDGISVIDSVRITADIPFQGYDEPAATLGKGDALYFYGQGRQQVIRPVIILDGFDPRDKRSSHYGLYNRKLSYGTSNLGTQLRLGNPLDGFGDKHDVIILNFPFYQTFDTGCRMEEVCIRRQFGQTKDDVQCMESQLVQVCSQRDGGADYIERNAMVLVKLIQLTNQQLQANGSSEKITLIGPSMGGLITRYALRYMEQNGINHNCKLWVSFDSPHKGANIPIGLQHFLDFQANGMGNQGAASNLRDLNTPAAKQMLIHHYLRYNNSPAGVNRETPGGAPGFRERFTQKLDEIGFPQTSCLRKVALNNGSTGGNNQGLPACEKALEIKGGISTAGSLTCFGVTGIACFFTGFLCPLVSVCVQANNIQLDNYIYTSPAGTNRCQVMYGDMLEGIFNVEPARRYSVGPGAGQESLDLLPGGYYDVFEETAQAARDTKLKWYEDLKAANAFFRRASFIPSGSSFALTDANRNWAYPMAFFDFTNARSQTPFDAIFAPVNNEEHVTVTTDGVDFLKAQLIAANNSQTSCAAVAQPLPNGCYTLKAKHSNKFIQPETANGGARLRQYNGNGQTAQIFSLEWVDNAAYRINSQSASRVVEAAGAGSGNGTPVVLGDWSGGSHQKWNLEAWGDGTYKLSPRNAPGKLFDVEGPSMNNGAGVHLWEQHGGDNQRFFVQSTGCSGTTEPPTGTCALSKIRIYPRKDCCAGRTIGGQVQYSTVGRNGPWVTAHTLSNEVANSYAEYGFGSVSSIKAVRYLSPNGGYGNVAEIEFYNGNTKLTGTQFDDGAGPWNGDPSRVAAKAMDGDVNTYYDSNNCCGAFVGLELNGCGGGGCAAPVPGISGGGNVCNGQTVTLTASGCGGTYRWSNGTNGVSSINVGGGTYSVACEQNGCTSASSAPVTVTANCGGGGGGCVVNRVRFKFRNAGDCCMDRLVGAKIQGSNDQNNWTDLYTFTASGTGSWQEQTFSNPTAYPYVRFLASSTGYGELFELEFYNGSTKLSGTAFGTSGVDGGTGYASAFDGNINTWWHGVFPGTGNYAGLNLGGCSGGRQAAEGAFPASPEAKGLLLVPNPATDYVELRLAGGEQARRATCYDALGRKLVETTESRMYVGRLTAGTYLIRVETTTGQAYGKMLVKP